MKSLRRTLAAATLAILAILAPAAPAAAITGGEPDGNRHPNVGLILFYQPDGRFRCSATLISPTVLITAAHCTDRHARQHPGDVRLGHRRAAAQPVPGRRRPECRLHRRRRSQAAGYLSGTAYTHPEYSNFTDLDNWNDVGVIVLDEPVTGITPATIAPLNYLDQFAQPALNSTIFELVGYGTEVRKPESGPQKPQPMSLPADPSLHHFSRPEADPADPPAQRQPERHPRRRRYLLRRLRRPGLPQRLPRGCDELRIHRQLPLPRRLPTRGHPGRPGLAGQPSC